MALDSAEFAAAMAVYLAANDHTIANRRGLVANLPSGLLLGELYYAYDTDTLYVGNGDGTALRLANGLALEAVASGGPKGTYANLAALAAAIPAGNTNIYITLDNGHWAYWNGAAWTDGGVYTATAAANMTVADAGGYLTTTPKTAESMSQDFGAQLAKIASLPAPFRVLLANDRLKISCLGDSITNGYIQATTSTYYTFINRLSNLLGRQAVPTGANLFSAAATAKSAGVTESGGVFTLNATSDANPRFGLTTGIDIVAGKLYLLSAELDSTNSAGLQLALRVFGNNVSNQLVSASEYNVGGFNASTGGYRKVYHIISVDFMQGINPTVTKINVGGELVTGSSAGKIGLIKNVELYELTWGKAVCNQGVDGDDTAEALARIATVQSWNPDICIIGLGTNDIRQNGIAITKEQYVANVETIADTLFADSIYPVIAAIPPLANTETNYDKVVEWNTALKAMAISNGYPYWDRYAALDGNVAYLADGRHPTADGYGLLASSLYQLLIGNRI